MNIKPMTYPEFCGKGYISQNKTVVESMDFKKITRLRLQEVTLLNGLKVRKIIADIEGLDNPVEIAFD